MNKTLIIAEAGVNHNGSIELAKQLCLEAKNAGADIVKFQTWKTDRIITKTTAMADYQAINTGKTESQYQMLKELELSYSAFSEIKKYCDEIGIQFLSTADEDESLDFLINELGIRQIKIGSGEISNIPFLRYIASKKLPVILSTGMSTLSDVDLAVRELQTYGATDITLLHCTTNYPCPMDEVNLNAMITLKHAFKFPVGYSDHTLGLEVPVAAVALGAKIIEKHFTLDCNLPGPDHKASLNPIQFKEMVTLIRNIEQAMGDGLKKPNKSEVAIMPVVKRTIVASTSIQKGDYFTTENIALKRANGIGLSSVFWDLLLTRQSQKTYKLDEIIEL